MNIFFFFFCFSSEKGNLVKVGNTFLATKGDSLNVFSISQRNDFLLIMANESIAEKLIPKGDIGIFKCKDLPLYKHATFQTNALVNGSGSFFYPAMSSFDLYLLDCYHNDTFDSVPVMKYYTHRTFLYVTITFLVEMILIVYIKIKFQKEINPEAREQYLGLRYIELYTTFIVLVDAIWIFLTFMKINVSKADLNSYYSGFFIIKSLFLLFLGTIAISGFPVYDCTFSIDILAALVLVFLILVSQHTRLSILFLIPLASLPIFIYHTRSEINSRRVNSFKQRLMNQDKDMFNLLILNGLDEIPFKIQSSFKLHGMFMIALAILNPMFSGFQNWQENQALSLSLGIVGWLYFIVKNVCKLEGIVLEKLVPSMLRIKKSD